MSGRHLQLFLLAREDTERCRIGISVGKRSGGSVVRNRLRRRVREIFRQGRHDLPAGLRIVVNIKPSAARAEFSELAADYVSALARGLTRLKLAR
jgi:ribonuclease P protein component